MLWHPRQQVRFGFCGWMQKSLFLLCCLFATAALAGQSSSPFVGVQIEGLAGLTSSMERVGDPTRQGSAADLQAGVLLTLPTRPTDPHDQTSPRWLRIDLQVPPKFIGVDAWLRLTPALIWEALLLHEDGRVQRAGLSLPLSEQTHAGYPPYFYLRLDKPEIRLYLKVTSGLPQLTHVMLLSDREMGIEILRDTLRQGLYMGAALLVALLSLINWFHTRDAVHRSFALYIGSFLVFYAFINGYASVWLFPAAPNLNVTLTVMVFALLLATTIRFGVDLMDLRVRMPRMAATLRLLSWLVVATGLLALEREWRVPVAWTLWVSHLVMGLVLLGLSLQQAVVRRNWQGWVLFSSFLIFTVFEKIPLFSVFGLVPVYPWVLDVAKLGLVIQLVLTHLHLVLRFKEQQGLKNVALAAQMEAQAERDHRQGLTQFLSMFGHEVRTPLAIIHSVTQSLELLPGADAPAISQRYQRIHAAVQRLTELSQEALSRDRLENSYLKPQLRPVVFKDLLAELFELLEISPAHGELKGDRLSAWRVAGEPGTLSLRGFDDPPDLMADQAMLVIALRNLLDNASRYAQPGSTVRMSVHARRGLVRLMVGSLGPELSAHEREQMFVRYWRRDEHTNVAGAGLGLTLVQQIAHAHRGKVEVVSRKRRWTWLIVSIPGRQK